MKKITFPVVLFLLAACSSNNESRQTEETVATVVTVDETVPDTVQVDAVTSATSKPNQVSFNGTMVIPPQRMATVSLTMGGVVKSTSLLPGRSARGRFSPLWRTRNSSPCSRLIWTVMPRLSIWKPNIAVRKLFRPNKQLLKRSFSRVKPITCR